VMHKAVTLVIGVDDVCTLANLVNSASKDASLAKGSDRNLRYPRLIFIFGTEKLRYNLTTILSEQARRSRYEIGRGQRTNSRPTM
jgi:hypothetical protein